MPLPPALTKQYGPFNGITWIGIVGGGVALAIVLRRSFSGAPSGAKEPVPTDADRLGLPGTRYHEPQGDGAPDPAPKGVPLPPGRLPPGPIGGNAPPKPAPRVSFVSPPGGVVHVGDRVTVIGTGLDQISIVGINGIGVPIDSKTSSKLVVTIPSTVKSGMMTGRVGAKLHNLAAIKVQGTLQPIPPKDQKCPTGQHYDQVQRKCVSDARVPPTDPIPGGFPADCTGVTPSSEGPLSFDPISVTAWQERYVQQGHSAHIAAQRSLSMAYAGTTGKANLRAVRNDYLSRGGEWLNGIRRANGLRALSQSKFNQLVADVDEEIRQHGSRDAFTQDFVFKLFARYYGPYMCR